MDGTRDALIIATDQYTDPRLRRLQAPASDARALEAVLRDPGIGGFDVHTLLNKPAHEVNLAVEGFFADRRPDDLLLVHFSGHGIKDEDGELYLAASNTVLGRLGATAVAAEFVSKRMHRSRSRRVVLLLDCCYAGAFERGLVARAGVDMGIEQQFGGRGRAVITASSAMEYAFEAGELADTHEIPPSVFTSALVQGLETGDADRDQDGRVGLDELYDYVYDKVRAATPNQTPGKWTFGMEGELYIARRSHPVTTPAPLPQSRILTDALRAARPLTDDFEKARALAFIAKAMAAADPGRAARLAADAERVARALTDDNQKASALARIAKEVAAADPDRAARLAQALSDDNQKASALARIAKMVAAADPGRAARLAADAERAAQAFTDDYQKALALADIAKAMAAADPDHAGKLAADAERVARALTDDNQKASALARIAKAMAAADPDRAARLAADAERAAQALTGYQKAWVLTDIAEVVATADPDHAGKLATDAELIARALTDDNLKAWALALTAEAVAAADPDRAARLAADAERAAQALTDDNLKARALARIAEAVAAVDLAAPL